MARGEDGSAGNAPITVDGALKDYKRDLEARNANPYNAESPRVHLTSVLLAKPVALLTATELKKWRDGLLGTMAPATINRLGRCVCAALSLSTLHDLRIKNRDAWEIGLADLPEAGISSSYHIANFFGLTEPIANRTPLPQSQRKHNRFGRLVSRVLTAVGLKK